MSVRAFELAEDFFQISANFSTGLVPSTFAYLVLPASASLDSSRSAVLSSDGIQPDVYVRFFLIIFTGSQFFTGNVVFAFTFGGLNLT